jgi:sensor histidine kinase YesM
VEGLELSVRNNVARPRSDTRIGVGLSNTRERLRTLFDDNYELDLIHCEDGSFLARVRIPYIESAEQEAA